MATVRGGNSGALLVVDVQNGVMAGAWDADRVVANVARAVERARAAAVPVVWVQHADDELPQGSPEWEWVPELARAEGEPLIHKSFNSAFEQTELDDALAALGTTHLTLAGAATNWCIRATAYGALERGYDVTLIEDAHTTESLDFPDGTRVEAARIVDELNVCLTWVAYPGRTNGTAPAEQVDFATPGGARRAEA